MFGDNPFAVPISSFQRPVPLVLVDPDDEPDYNVCFRKEWLPYILACLQQLWLQTTWKTDDLDALALQQERAKLLTSMFMHECPMCEAELPTTGGCTSFPPDSSIISWKPQNPFTQPDYIPPGYIAVPFLEVTAGSLISFFPGAEVGDVISGWLSMPVPLPSTADSVAQFRIHVKGAGVVELHLLRFPGGGTAIITADNEVGSIRTVNLNKDLVQAPPETLGVIVVEIPFTTLGEHTIDVSFVPRFNDELVFLSYGGGLRSVVLCGFDQTIEQQIVARAKKGAISVDERQDMAIRVDPDRCYMLQFECAPGDWQDLLDTRCGAIEQGRQPTDGAALLPGQCREWDVVLNGRDKWLLPVQVNTADTIEITGAKGAWNDGTLLWFCPSGQLFLANLCGGAAAAEVGDPITSLNHMRLIENINGLAWVDGFNTIYAVQDAVSDGTVYFQANDGSLNDNTGTISFHVKVCRPDDVATPFAINMHVGTGPTSVQPGQLFTMTSGFAAGLDNVEFDVTPCGRITFLTASGWSTPTVPGSTAWNVVDCASANHLEGAPTSNSPTIVVSQECSVYGINGAAPFSVTCKIDPL